MLSAEASPLACPPTPSTDWPPTRPTPKRIQRLFELKERPSDRSIAVLVADLAAAETLVDFTPQARRLAEHFWPGPLTIVAARTPAAPPHLGTGATIGVRLPDDDIMRAVAGSRHRWP